LHNYGPKAAAPVAGSQNSSLFRLPAVTTSAALWQTVPMCPGSAPWEGAPNRNRIFHTPEGKACLFGKSKL